MAYCHKVKRIRDSGCTGLPLDLTLALAPDPLLEAVVASIWPFTIS